MCELIMASSMYSSYSKNLVRRRQGKLTVRSSLPLWVCVNERLRSHGTGERRLIVACKLRLLSIVLLMVEPELEHSEHLWWKWSRSILRIYI